MSKIYTRALPCFHYICNIIIVLVSIKKNFEFCVGPAARSKWLPIYWWHLSGVQQLPSQCPPWQCLGSLVHFVGPFWSCPQLFTISICSVLFPHLSDWYHHIRYLPRSEGGFKTKKMFQTSVLPFLNHLNEPVWNM